MVLLYPARTQLKKKRLVTTQCWFGVRQMCVICAVGLVCDCGQDVDEYLSLLHSIWLKFVHYFTCGYIFYLCFSHQDNIFQLDIPFSRWGGLRAEWQKQTTKGSLGVTGSARACKPGLYLSVRGSYSRSDYGPVCINTMTKVPEAGCTCYVTCIYSYLINRLNILLFSIP